jgi:rubrerythrin
MNFLSAIETISGIADRTGVKDINQVFAVIKEVEAFHAKEHSERSASPDDKAKVASLFDSLDGAIVELKDIPMKDIVSRAGARDNQGVRMHAKRDLAKRLLTYTKPAEPANAEEADTDPALRPVKKSASK